MDLDLPTGTRSTLTTLDWAMLKDIGWTVSASVKSAAASVAPVPPTITLPPVNHPEAKAHVQYALLAARGEAAPELIDLPDPGAHPDVLAFSGWQRVSPDGQPQLLALEFREALDAPADLVFATRVAPGECLDYAWAEWADVRFRVRGHTVQAVTGAAAKDRLRLVA